MNIWIKSPPFMYRGIL